MFRSGGGGWRRGGKMVEGEGMETWRGEERWLRGRVRQKRRGKRGGEGKEVAERRGWRRLEA